MSVNFAQMKKKWEKRKQARIKEGKAKKEEAKRKRKSRTVRKAIEEANKPELEFLTMAVLYQPTGSFRSSAIENGARRGAFRNSEKSF